MALLALAGPFVVHDNYHCGPHSSKELFLVSPLLFFVGVLEGRLMPGRRNNFSETLSLLPVSCAMAGRAHTQGQVEWAYLAAVLDYFKCHEDYQV